MSVFHYLGDDLQQDPASVHLQHVDGGDDHRADQQPGCYRDQPADVVLLPLPQPLGHACAGNSTSMHSMFCNDVALTTLMVCECKPDLYLVFVIVNL